MVSVSGFSKLLLLKLECSCIFFILSHIFDGEIWRLFNVNFRG